MNLFIAVFKYFILPAISFYSLTVTDIDGNNIAFSSFEGKKVLIINIAAKGIDTSELRSLEQLHQAHKDSLVVLAVPSKDFGNLPYSNPEIKLVLQQYFKAHYTILPITAVADSAALLPLYQWLTRSQQNGITDASVTKDFYKFLVSKEGVMKGVFSNEVKLTDTLFVNAITQ